MSDDTITLTVNGESRTLPTGTSLGDFLRGLDFDPRAVAVERNGAILKRDSFEATQLVEGDRLEIVRFVQGG